MSEKKWITWLDFARVLATLLIVLYHVPSSAFFRGATPHQPAWYLLHFFGSAGAVIAFFFATSAFLTPINADRSKILRKVVGLAIPYILWNLICAPGLRDEMSLGRVFGFGTPNALCADYPLWYLRDLMILLLLLPLYERIAPLIALAAALITVFQQAAQWEPQVLAYLPFPKATSWLFFASGLLARRISADAWRRIIFVSSPLWFALSLSAVVTEFPFPPVLFTYVFLFSIVAAGILLERLIRRWSPAIRVAAQASFLCYAAHAPALLVLGYVASLFFPQAAEHSWPALALPPFIYGASVAAYLLMKRFTPRLLPFLAHSGSLRRNLRQNEQKQLPTRR